MRRAIAGLALLIGGCTVGPNFVPPKMDLPAQFTEANATPGSVAATQVRLSHWWRSFDDPMLDDLIAQGIASNIDLRQADVRLVQARAERDAVAADAYPTIDAGGALKRARASTTVEYPPGFGNYSAFQLGFDAAWELDIFGGNRRATEASTDQMLATLYGRRALLVSLTAEIASDYASLRAAQYRLAIAHENVRTAQQALGLARQELVGGLGTDLAARQAKSQVEATEARLPPLQAQVAVMAHAIGVLLGRFPGALEERLKLPMPLMSLPPTLPSSVPAEVIADRPDVHEAEMRYAAANAEIGVAVAQRLPHVSIPLLLTPEGSAINTLFTGASMTYSLALAATQRVYDGGKLQARERAARAAAEAARLAYKTTVLKALQEVENALARLRADQAQLTSLTASLMDAQIALDQASRLYHAGLVGFLTVLTDERTIFASRDAVAVTQVAQVQDLIALFKALGGGWKEIDIGTPSPQVDTTGGVPDPRVFLPQHARAADWTLAAGPSPSPTASNVCCHTPKDRTW